MVPLSIGPSRGPAAVPTPPPSRPTAQLVVTTRSSGTVSPYLFGANLLWPYDAEGAFDPRTGHFYPAFLHALTELHISALRYPGGTTADSFQWQRAIGPQARRRLNEPFGMQAAVLSDVCCKLSLPVPSTVGPDQFGRLLQHTGAVGDVTVNFVTGNARQAAELVAYMTAPLPRHPTGNRANTGYWAELRARNGHPGPYNVRYWEVGNEQDGPGQYGWRSGALVSFGHHVGHCSPSEVPDCLYAFGGTTRFVREPVGLFADQLPQATLSSGRQHQVFYAYFPPVVPASQTVYVAGRTWHEVHRLSTVGPGAHAYSFRPSSGAIAFGNGRHGAVPAAGAPISISYMSGPHDGFVEFYAAMKKVAPHAQICESDEARANFFRLMGHRYPYDCIELHEYARPLDLTAPMTAYERQLMTTPALEGARVGRVEAAARRYSGRRPPVVVTEYGQLVTPMPAADPRFNLSLDEGLLVASQLRQWILHHVPLAEKYLAVASAFRHRYPVTLRSAASPVIDSAMVAGAGGRFVVEPSGQAVAMMSALAGGRLLAYHLDHGPVMPTGGSGAVAVLQPVAAQVGDRAYVAVINTDPYAPVRARVSFPGRRLVPDVTATVLDGPGPLAFNTPTRAATVTADISRWHLHGDSFGWRFPAHSLTLLEATTRP